MPTEIFLQPTRVRFTRPDNSRAYSSKFDVYNSTITRQGFHVYALREGEVRLSVTTAAQNVLNSIANDSECTRLATESNLDDALSAGQANSLQNDLEIWEIPAQWIVSGMTRRTVVRYIIAMFQINIRTEGLQQRKVEADLTAWVKSGGLTSVPGHENDNLLEFGQQCKNAKALQYQELPANVKQYLHDFRDRQGWNNADLGLTQTSTVREILQAAHLQGFGVRRRMARYGLTLNSEYQSFPQAWKDEILEVIASFGMTPAQLGLTATSTLRQFMKAFADERMNKTFSIGGLVI